MTSVSYANRIKGSKGGGKGVPLCSRKLCLVARPFAKRMFLFFANKGSVLGIVAVTYYMGKTVCTSVIRFQNH